VRAKSKSIKVKERTGMGESLRKDYTVAYYDFRSKQDYIYRTNEMREITGASIIMEGAYQDFIKEYNDEGDGVIRVAEPPDTPFELQAFDGQPCQGEVLYEGGGNMLIIFKNTTDCQAFNRHFSLWLVKKTYSLTFICSFVTFAELQSALQSDNPNYRDVRDAVFKKHDQTKRLSSPRSFANVLPFTQIDRKTALPITHKRAYPLERESLSQESELKRQAYDEWRKETRDNKAADDEAANPAKPSKDDASAGVEEHEKHLDKIVTEKGVESLLAVIYIDGNDMGERIKSYIDEDASFEAGVNAMREFSLHIKQAFVLKPREKIKHLVETNAAQSDGGSTVKSLRHVIGGGDEVTIVCNARIALEIVKAYFDSLDETNKELPSERPPYSACAGIAIFHSHAPFTTAYKIAEKCCENGKKRRRELPDSAGEPDNQPQPFKDNCYLDYYYFMSGVTGELEELREKQEQDRTNTPYCIRGEDTAHCFCDFNGVAEELQKAKRANVKALRDAALKSDTDFEIELERIRSRVPSFALGQTDGGAAKAAKSAPKATKILKKIVYDVATVYDLWFREEDAQDAKN
jgi:hypothetical protein